MPRYELDQKEIPDVVTLEELSQMSYQYADEEERTYYTQWKRDLISQGDHDARMSIAKTLASNGFDAEKIASFTGLSSADVQAALQVNQQP